MNQDEIKELFQDALDASPDRRRALLDARCAGRPELRAEIEGLLRDHEAAGAFLEGPTGGGMDPGAASHDPVPGSRIDAYRVREELGEGGFGVVYVAEQLEPVRRDVALKILKAGMDTRDVVARFEAERQALALMDHPHIARVFDGGATPGGRPYLVMELVHGVPIHEYCDRTQLPVRDRIALFREVCAAVEHAHQKGVIHRDLKPSNVLVEIRDGAPAPKVIDFGVAKAIGFRLTDQTVRTGFAQMIGTPQYMSPEQAELSALDVDTRSDVYALGAMLYELLTGSTPFPPEQLRNATFDEFRRLVREVDPPTPSDRLTARNGDGHAIAAARRTGPRRLTRELRGELDWIVMKALEKDRTRRYQSAQEFGADLGRYLADEPVLARRPSVAYRGRKFARRNRTALIVAALLVAAAVVPLEQWRERRGRRDAADRAVSAALAQARAALADGRAPEAASALERARGVVDGGDAEPRFARALREAQRDLELIERLEQARLRSAVARIQGGVDWSLGDRSYEEAFQSIGIEPEDIGSAATLARLEASAIRSSIVDALDDWLFVRRERHIGIPDAMWDAVQRLDDDPVRRRVRDALRTGDADSVSRLAPKDPGSAATARLIGQALAGGGRVAEAIDVLETALRDHPADVWLYRDLAKYTIELEPFWPMPPQPLPERFLDIGRRAAAFARAAVALRPESPIPRFNLAGALLMLRKWDEAEVEVNEALRRAPGSRSGVVLRGHALRGKGKLEDAVACYQQALAIRRDSRVLVHLGHARVAQGREDDAIAAFLEAVKLDREDPLALMLLGNAYARKGDMARAEQALERSLAMGHPPPELFANLGTVRAERGNPRGAIVAFQEALRRDPEIPDLRRRLATALSDVGDFQTALVVAEERRRRNPMHAEAHCDYGLALIQAGRYDEAIRACEAALAVNPKLPNAYANIGMALRAKRDFDGSAMAYQRALDADPGFVVAYINYGALLHDRGQNDRALELLRKAVELQDDSFEAQMNLALALADGGQHKEALEHYERASKIQPGRCEPWFGIGAVAFTLGDFARALAAYERGLPFRDEPEVRARIGDCHRRLGAPDKAIECYTAAIRVRPELNAVLGLGLAYENKGDHERAAQAFRQATARWADSAAAHANLGSTLLNLKRPDDAIPELQRAIELDPKSPDSHYNLGNAFAAKGDMPRAIRCYRDSVAARPNWLAFNNLGNALLQTDDVDGAIQAFRDTLRLNPAWIGARLMIANQLRGRGDWDAALTEYGKAIEQDAGNAYAHFGIGMILHGRGRMDDARKEWAQALAAEPRQPWFRNDIAWALANAEDPACRDPARAVAMATEAATQQDDAPAIWVTLGLALYRNGQAERAVKALERAVALQGGSTAWDAFLLAMAHASLDHAADARTHHDHAVAWMAANAPKDPQLLRFRAESEALLESR